MQQQAFIAFHNQIERWLVEANAIEAKLIPTEKEVARAKTLLDCAEALNNTLTEITDSEKELVLTNH